MAEDLNIIEWRGDKVFVPECLTPAQFAILKLSARGMDQYRISELMGYRPQTIKHYRSRMLRALGVSSTKHAVALAYEKGWLTNENGQMAEANAAA